jgi:flagellar motor switch protein FliM
MTSELEFTEFPEPADETAGAGPSSESGQLPAAAMETMETIHRGFLRMLEVRLTELLRRPVTASLSATSVSTFGSLLESLPVGGSFHALDLLPNRGQAILSFPALPLVRGLEILLSAPVSTSLERETVTPIELHILRDWFQGTLLSLRHAWAETYPVSFAPIQSAESDPRNGFRDSLDDSALLLTSTLEFGETTAYFFLALPSFLVRLSAMAASRTPPPSRSQLNAEQIEAALAKARLQVEAVVHGGKIPIRELLALRSGQILSVGKATTEPFDCLINGMPRFSGQFTVFGNRRALVVNGKTNCAAG